jgi:hypothetical protein
MMMLRNASCADAPACAPLADILVVGRTYRSV